MVSGGGMGVQDTTKRGLFGPDQTMDLKAFSLLGVARIAQTSADEKYCLFLLHQHG